MYFDVSFVMLDHHHKTIAGYTLCIFSAFGGPS